MSLIYHLGKAETSQEGVKDLDDAGWNKYWYRFSCIDEKYREWEQPYYAINFEKEGSDFKGVCINKLSPKLISFFREKKLNDILS